MSMDTPLTEAWRTGNLAALERLGCKIGPGAQITQACREATQTPTAKGAEPAPSLVSPGVAIVHGKLVAMIPVKTASEVNGRDWRKRSRRSGEAWKAVSRTLGPHLDLLSPMALAYHDQKALRVLFVRLGCRKMDRSNLPSAMKGCEDAIAFLLGADDGDARWHSSFEQDQEHEGVGVKIEIALAEIDRPS